MHEIKNEILQDYTGVFELYGKMTIEPIELETNIRFKNLDDFKKYIYNIDYTIDYYTIDIDYDSEDVFFTGYLYKLDTPQFNVVRRSAYGIGTSYMREIVEFDGQNCYIPISAMCFIKCINYFTKKDYTEEFLTFIRSKQRRSNVMTSTRIQPFCKKYNINTGVFDGTRINPRNLTQRNTSLFIDNHFCLIWKSDGKSLDKAIKELKDNFEVVDSVISDKHVKSFN